MIGIKTQKGFTLVEIIVVMSVFLFVIGAIFLVFISSVSQQRITMLKQVSINETSYVFEYMSKALRMAKRATLTDGCIPDGYIYQLTEDDDGVYLGIKFLNYLYETPLCDEFYLDKDTKILMEKKGTDAAVPLTSNKLKINSIRFGVNGANGCYDNGISCPLGALYSTVDPIQPKVTILLNFQIGDEQRTIQTTVSQRNLNTQ